MTKSKTGKFGEQLAVKFLQDRGYEIIARNYYCRHGEIDIIAQREGEMIFVEVKTRSNAKFGFPEDSFSKRKRGKILRAVERFLVEKRIESDYRIDLICVEINKNERKAKIKHFKDVVIDIFDRN